ncbi:thioredoxin family protein [Polaribacter reichenbachii]|uniref:Thioredoxin n=1 Tax=Polaribacter reichenbachii TaxID=996801 RepID=A0A1B8TUA6_9FLAO|nr:thioredoxin family protein [Polaribacter reichenbachii]APZ45742.1 thioredoxin family protein [Polaribacter reichenbachii]AUC19603.1 thioredoxin family protein [Polaribacter reichenbachii]OBY63243.1 thioredoxin [Polaribacter reichenbachii]
MKEIIKQSLENTYTYQEYRDLVSTLLSDGKATGPNQSEDLTNYSLLNDRRMKRLDKTIKINEETSNEINELREPQTWLLIAEGWCGDAAQNIPVIHKMAELNKNIDLKIVLRDDNLELMDLFLTNGGRSIPKLIALDNENNVIDTWGPRPTLATKMVADYKVKNGAIDAQFKQDLQVWYNKDKGKSTQEDFVKMIQKSTLKEV